MSGKWLCVRSEILYAKLRVEFLRRCCLRDISAANEDSSTKEDFIRESSQVEALLRTIYHWDSSSPTTMAHITCVYKNHEKVILKKTDEFRLISVTGYYLKNCLNLILKCIWLIWIWFLDFSWSNDGTFGELSLVYRTIFWTLWSYKILRFPIKIAEEVRKR